MDGNWLIEFLFRLIAAFIAAACIGGGSAWAVALLLQDKMRTR